MRQHGALDAAGIERLDRHLTGCASCRRFADSTQSMEKIMTDAGFVLAEGMDWERVRGRIGAMGNRMRQEMILVAITMPLVAGFALWLTPPRGLAVWTLALGFMVAIVAVAFFLSRRRREDLRWAQHAGPAGFRFYREQLDKRLVGVRKESWSSLVSVFFLVLSMYPQWDHAKGILASIGLGALGLGWWLYLRLVEKPRLERERAELGE